MKERIEEMLDRIQQRLYELSFEVDIMYDEKNLSDVYKNLKIADELTKNLFALAESYVNGEDEDNE